MTLEGKIELEVQKLIRKETLSFEELQFLYDYYKSKNRFLVSESTEVITKEDYD